MIKPEIKKWKSCNANHTFLLAKKSHDVAIFWGDAFFWRDMFNVLIESISVCYFITSWYDQPPNWNRFLFGVGTHKSVGGLKLFKLTTTKQNYQEVGT